MVFDRKHDRFSLLLPSITIFLVGSIIAVISAVWYHQSALDKEHIAFETKAASQLEGLETVLQSRLGALTVLTSLLQNVGVVERDAFSGFTKPLVADHEGIRSLGWIPYVTETDANGFATFSGAVGSSELKILEREVSGRISQAALRSEYFPLYYSEPLDSNRDALGLNLGAELVHRIAIENAWFSGKQVATSPIRLGANNSTRAEIYVYAPVYSRAENTATIQGRTQGILGFAVVVLDMASLTNVAVKTADIIDTQHPTDFYIYDVAEDGVVAPVYSTNKGVGADATMEYLGLRDQYPDKFIEVQGRTWHVIVKPDFAFIVPMSFVATILAVGVLISALVAFYVLTLRKKGVTDVRTVQARTRELEIAHKRARGAELDIALANKAKATFLATMSHELRTPLTGVLGYIDLLCSKITDPDHKQLIDKLRQAANAQRAIVNNVLDYSRISAGTLTIEKEPFRLQDVIDAAVSTYGTMAKEKGVFVGCKTPPGMPTDFLGDPARLQQVVNNLVSNAVKFTMSGSVTLHLVGAHVDGENYDLEITVQDTGIGIAEDKMEELFEPFVHTEDVMTRRFGGTGLGLSICREITEAMGGSIHVESKLDWGSKFTVALTLPLTEIKDETHQEHSQKILFGGVPLRILVVEDYMLVRDMLTATLMKAGHVVVAVENGSEAYEAIYSPVGETFDLVIMDMHMPIMDGPDAARRIRNLGGKAAYLPIIGISVDVMSEHVQRFTKSGINAFVPKPIEWNELGRVMQKVMREAHENMALQQKPVPGRPLTGQPLLLADIFADFVEPLTPNQSSDLYEATMAFFADCGVQLKSLADKPDFVESKKLAHSIMGGASTIGAMKVSENAHRFCKLKEEPRDLSRRLERMYELLKQSQDAFGEQFQHVKIETDEKDRTVH